MTLEIVNNKLIQSSGGYPSKLVKEQKSEQLSTRVTRTLEMLQNNEQTTCRKGPRVLTTIKQ